MSMESIEKNQNLYEQLKNQHANFIIQRDLALNNYNQLIGAIFSCEQMIKNFEEQINLNNQKESANG